MGGLGGVVACLGRGAKLSCIEFRLCIIEKRLRSFPRSTLIFRIQYT